MFATQLITAFALAASVASAAPAAKRDLSGNGQATFYDAGLGACGWINSASDYVVAVNSEQYDSSYCGQYVTITNSANGNTETAQIADLCPSCSWGALDMSTSLFSALNNGDMDAGIFQMEWSTTSN